MRDVVEKIIKPDTAGRMMGLAVLRNLQSPLRARVVVSHSWDEEYDEFVKALQCSGHSGPFWICSFALYQHFDKMEFEKQFGEDPFSGPYKRVLQQAERLLMVITAKEDANPLERLFCRAEFACALSLNKAVDFASVTTISEPQHSMKISDSLMELLNRDSPELNVDLWADPYYSQELNENAKTGKADDMKQIDRDNRTHLINRLEGFPNLHVHILDAQCQALKKHSLPASEFAKVGSVQVYTSFLEQRQVLAQQLEEALRQAPSTSFQKQRALGGFDDANAF